MVYELLQQSSSVDSRGPELLQQQQYSYPVLLLYEQYSCYGTNMILVPVVCTAAQSILESIISPFRERRTNMMQFATFRTRDGLVGSTAW